MAKYTVVLSGAMVANDEALIEALQAHVTLIRNAHPSQLEAVLDQQAVDLLLLEITTQDTATVEQIGAIKKRVPQLEILLINGNGNRELLARAFALGARDAFRKPYLPALIVERVLGVLKGKTKKNAG